MFTSPMKAFLPSIIQSNPDDRAERKREPAISLPAIFINASRQIRQTTEAGHPDARQTHSPSTNAKSITITITTQNKMAMTMTRMSDIYY
jgi:hypothetical protein